MKSNILNGAAAAAIAAAIAGATGGAAHADEGACAQTAGAQLAQTQITGAAWIEATDTLPAYCEVQGVIRPVAGSEIGVVYRLPDDWNGRVLGIGGGGWMGNVTLEAAAEGIVRGYATMQTDAGHPADAGTGFDPSPWALNPDGSLNEPKMEDFSHRAIHLMTERGKDLAAEYYGQTHRQAVYLGCSTGGRMGLMEAQRYPSDYDGIIAGAPVYTLQTQTSAVLRSAAFEQPGARLRPAHLQLLNRAALTTCDAADGAADGVLRDPRTCDFDPRDLICEGEPKDTCLTEAQAAAVARVYEGEAMANGEIASFPLEKGGETGWLRFVPSTEPGEPGTNSGGLYAFRGPLMGDPDYDMANFTAETVGQVRGTWMAETYEADDPRIGEFVGGGGKLILWHGTNDPGPSQRATIDYYEAALEATPGAADSMRLFLAPGVEHCRGGVGPNTMDWLTVMESWLLEDQTPEEVPATRPDEALAWNLCAYPKLPTGQEDGSYACE